MSRHGGCVCVSGRETERVLSLMWRGWRRRGVDGRPYFLFHLPAFLFALHRDLSSLEYTWVEYCTCLWAGAGAGESEQGEEWRAQGGRWRRRQREWDTHTHSETESVATLGEKRWGGENEGGAEEGRERGGKGRRGAGYAHSGPRIVSSSV